MLPSGSQHMSRTNWHVPVSDPSTLDVNLLVVYPYLEQIN